MAEPRFVRLQKIARHSDRVYLRIPVEVRGQTEGGAPFTERTHTLAINRNGARISLTHPLESGQLIQLTNLQTDNRCAFRVVGSVGKIHGKVREWGVECLHPELDFWRIHFPSDDNASPHDEQVDALVECTVCHLRELARLSLGDYRRLSEQGTLERNCQTCGKSDWRFGYAEALAQSEPRPGNAVTPDAEEADNRIARRLAVHLPISIRLPDGREEPARTENLSKMGVCFVTDLNLEEGEFIRLTVGYVLGADADEVTARVVWRRALDESKRYVYGVHLEDDGQGAQRL